MRTKVQNKEDYITATLKISEDLGVAFTEKLAGDSKNGWTLDLLNTLYIKFQDADIAHEYFIEMLKYSQGRKRYGVTNERNKLKTFIVSVKVRKDIYFAVMDVAQDYGVTFSELVRREIVKMVES